MIKKDVRYIIKRIIIGVGIVLVLSCLNGCKVKAWSFTNNYRSKTKNSIINNSDIKELKTYNHITFYQNQVNKSVYFCANYSNTCYEMYFTGNNFQYENIGLLISSPVSSSSTALYRSCAYMSKSTLPKFMYSDSYEWNYATYSSNTYIFCVFSRNSDNTFGDAAFVNVNNENGEAFYGGNINPSKSSSNYQWYSNINWNYYNNLEVPDDNIIGATIPEFLSFNAIPITTNNVITSYTIQPEFSSFDTENYVYQYSFNNKRWLSLTQNNQILRINNNSSIYVRFKDKKTNEIIDTANLTITNIGTFYNNQTYNINFSGDYRTQNYLDHNICAFEGSKSEIKEYQIYIDYVPKSSILKYQYQFVPTDSQLDNNNWQNVPTSDNGSITYVAAENGTLYARILDKEDNVLKFSTFQVSSIGKIAIDDIDKQCTKNIFQKFSSEINYGGPVSVIFKIPVDVLSSLYNTASTSNTCHPYVISKLMGTNFVLPCFDLENKFGSTIYREIDAMLCFILSIMFFKFLLKIYNDFISMKDIN